MGSDELLTLGQVSVRVGCGLLPWHLDRLCARQAIPFVRAKRLRLVRAGDLDAVRAAAVAAGYVREKELVSA